MTKEFHRIADLYPLMQENESEKNLWPAFKNDILTNGLLEPIILFNDKILDGRNREIACEETNIIPRYENFKGTEIEACSFVISKNHMRRHLTSSQIAGIAIRNKKLYNSIKEAADKRMKAGLDLSQLIDEGQNPRQQIVKGSSSGELAKQVGTNRQYIQDAEKIEASDPDMLDDICNGRITITKANKQRKKEVRDENKEVIPLPTGVYNVILADPPWKYDFSSTNVRSIESHYNTMELHEIKELEIPSHKDSVLYLWATTPKLIEALEVMEAWGFQYKSNLVWDKGIIGTGYWWRGQHELLLVGTKGNFSPPPEADRISSVLREKRTEHSKKPTIIYDWLEKWFPEAKFLELFARNNKREKWTSWGDQNE